MDLIKTGSKSFNYINSYLTNVNSSKITIGIAMIMFNLGSKYIIMDISKNQEQFFKNIIIRRLTLFCIFFVATRDIFISLVLTAVFVVLAFGLFHQDSKYCILSNSFYDNTYTKDEYEMSKTIISEYEKTNPNLDFCNNKS
jgi:hypothetical protein